MTKIPFSLLSLTPKVERAIALMGFDDATPIQTVVEIPEGSADDVIEAMAGCKISGRQVTVEKLAEKPNKQKRRH
ncbi:MAG: hypothetical protein GXY05_14290 [Clostridiales bacterium]|nr:hypothetical protein [Clostridiales bacterium]